MSNTDNQTLLYWLLRGYMAERRTGWERGPSVDEVFSIINHVLHEHGVCGLGEDCCAAQEKTRELLEMHDRKEWKG